jgi:hypothetical protein
MADLLTASGKTMFLVSFQRSGRTLYVRRTRFEGDQLMTVDWTSERSGARQFGRLTADTLAGQMRQPGFRFSGIAVEPVAVAQ